ncbi:MAG: bi-domain-containing oxidoreductase, partial [Pseudomonadota bacterium]
IAMHGVRQADQQVGANILVVGLGLVGQITAQISKASGHRVIGLDFDQRKNKLAKDNGIIDAFNPEDPDLISKIMNLTEGRGVDAVLLTAASKNSGQVFDKVSDLCRDRAKIVVVGEVKMDMTRRYFFNKELEILQSRSYGPGRYDTNYEEKGQDYPVGYVRWTERRNMESFIDLLSRKLVSVDHLTTHSFDFDEAEKAYELLEKPPKDDLLIGVLLKYKEKNDTVEKLPASVKRTNKDTLNLGVIGTGRFARGILLPAFNENKKFRLAAVSSASGLSAQSVADKFASDVVTSDTSAILKDPNIDAVVIATRPDLHAKFVIEALKENKHVYVEKPLCLTYDELSEIQQTYSNSDTILTVGFNRRFSPLITKMKTHFEGRQEPLTMMYRVNAGRINLNAPEGWVHDPAIGGGRIISEACHFIDTMSAICGAKVTEIHSMATNPRRDDLAGNDNVTLTCRFDDGSIGTVHYFSNGDKSMAKEYLEVFGEEKIAVLDNYRTLRLVRNNRSKVHRSLKLEKGFKEEIEGFYKAIASGKNPIDIDSIYATTHMTIQATEQVQGSGI